MLSQRSRAVRARRRVPIVLVAMCCLLVSLLGPWLTTSAAVPNAQATTAATQPPVQQPTQPPIQQPTTPPTAPPTQAPTQPAQNTGTLVIFKYDCGPGYDPTKQGANPVQDCQNGQNGVQFNIAGQNSGFTSQSSTGDSQPGAVMFGGIPFDNYTVVETVPQGYGAPLVYCGTQNTSPQQQQLQQMQVTNGNQVMLPLQTAFVVCGWYNIPTAPATTTPAATSTAPPGTPSTISSPSAHLLPPGSGGQLAVNLFFCPNYDPVADPNFTTSASQCTNKSTQSVTFNVIANGVPQPPVQTTTGDFTGWILGLAAGNVAVVETLPAGFGSSFVACGMDDPATNTPANPQPISSAYGTTIHTDVADGKTTVCNWYNLPPAKVVINKHGCATDFDPTNATLNDLAQKCQDPQPGVKFTITKSGGQTEDQTTPNTGLSLVTFQNLAGFANITVAETTPDGYGTPLVYCKTEDPNGGGATSPEQKMDITGGTTITWPLKPNQLVFCDWFNIPVGTIYINKHGCTPGAINPANATLNDLAANCNVLLPGVAFTVTKGTTTVATGTTAGTPSAVLFKNLQPGKVTITESMPTGYDVALVYCKVLGKNGGPSGPEQDLPFDPTNHSVDWTVVGGQDVFCDWFNIPSTPSTVTIVKWLCPKDYDPTKQGANPKTDCAQPESGIDFTLTDTKGSTKMTTGANGQVQWTNVQPGQITITETIPNGYGVPFVTCQELNSVQGPTQVVLTPNGVYKTILVAGHSLRCDWFNIPRSPGSITIYKWVCPAGYDVTAGGADPKKDCAQPVNGVQFNLAGQNTGYTSQSNTGDSIPGAVTFGGIQPDTYTVTETVPADTAMVFVGDCTGGTNAAVHPFPLSTGNVLKIDVGGGDKIVCNWYNVPVVKGGTLTVHKQVCSTATFVSTLDCLTFSGGQAFTLLGWNGAQWVQVANGTTNTLGVVSWTGLTPGTYQVTEPGKTPCNVMSQGLQKGGGLTVAAGQETIVWVYNCGIKPPPQTPTKFPNTGVGPMDGGTGGGPGSGVALLLSALALALLAAVAGMRGLFRSVALPAFRRPAPRLPRRGLAFLLAGTIVTSTLALSLAPAAAQPTIVAPNTCVPTATAPKNATKTQKANVQAGNASIAAAAALDPACNEVPVAIRIKSAHVDAKIEVLEVIDGVMQAPSGADKVAWYKSSPRLGQPGNMLMAGHLNWWGVPQAVFFYLNTLQKGDLIQVTGQGGEVYTYRVEWNRLEDATKPPTNEVVGKTKTPSLTLITCGGTWIPSASEYDSRTVVRATFVSVQQPKK